MVYLELPAEGTELTAGAPFGEIESAKTVAELFAPVSGELIGVNGELEDRPELVNESPLRGGLDCAVCESPTPTSWTICWTPTPIVR